MIGFWDGTGISQTVFYQSASRSKQRTTSTSCHSIFARQMFFLKLNQQCQSTEGNRMLNLLVCLQQLQAFSPNADNSGICITI